MAVTGFSSSIYLRLHDDAGITISSGSRQMIVFWAKWSTSINSTNEPLISWMSAVSSPSIVIDVHARGSNNDIVWRGTSGAESQASMASTAAMFSEGAWHHIGLMVPIHNDATGTLYGWLDGTEFSASMNTDSFSTNMDTIRVGRSAGGGAPTSTTKMAHLGLCSPADLTAARAIISSLPSTPPKSIAGMTFAWDLIVDRLADLGGVDFNVVGSPTYDADDPYASAPAAALGNHAHSWW